MVQAVAWATAVGWGALSTDIMKNDCMKNTERQTTRSVTTAAVAILSGEMLRLSGRLCPQWRPWPAPPGRQTRYSFVLSLAYLQHCNFVFVCPRAAVNCT